MAPKFVPVTVTSVPIPPDDGLRPVIVGAAGLTMKFTPLLGVPPTVTTTLPVVAEVGTKATTEVSLQPVATAEAPLNATVLVC